MKTDTPKAILLKDYEPSPYLIDTVHLDVSLHPTATRVVAKLKMRPNPAAKKPRALILDGESITLVGVKIDGTPISGKDYTVTKQSLTIPRVPATAFVLEITTTCNPEANTALSGLYRSRGIYCTQCEAEGFRRITFFLDRPDVLATYTTRIEADIDDASVLLANGNPIERGTMHGSKRHYAVWKDPHPKPAYLFALVGGNLASFASDFKTMSGRKVDLRIYVEPGKEKRCAWAMDSLKRSMLWDEQRFGREYDLDVFNIVAVSDFNMGAMENKGLNIFNDRLVLASADTATDQNYTDIERVIAHEYFHNWTGNRITCRDWFQLCLKEGLTVFRDQEFSADMRSRTVQRIADVRNLKGRQFAEDSGPLAHPVRPDRYIEINNFYTSTIYEKGAELVRMIATLLGPVDFRHGMDLFFERHDGDAATVEQFVQCFADVSQRDFDQFMTWYSQAGTPQLVASLNYDARHKTVDLHIEQVLPPTPGQPKKKPLHMPLRLGLLGTDGKELALVTSTHNSPPQSVVELTKRSETFRFTGIDSRPVPSLLRGFSAPVNLTLDLADRDLQFLMANDSDLFNRWQATQDYAGRILIDAVKAFRNAKRPAKPAAFIAALKATIINETLEPAYRAQILAMPAQGDIARIIGQDVDPSAIHKASVWLAKSIATNLAEDLLGLYERHAVRGKYSPDATQAGKRALRNRALAVLFQRGQNEDIERVVAHYDGAKNATDEILGLALLSTARGPERKAALERFFNRWKDDHLVIDSWFGLQASSPLSSSLGAVKSLMRHPSFALTNPNKVRALLFTFAGSNPVNFNRPDGAGYDFVADRVKELDTINPQVAARLLGAFRSWRALEPERRKAAKKTLTGLAKSKKLSRDVYEIATKILD
jgi:aminopeptidase N